MPNQPKNRAQLLSEFKELPMNWYSIYNWDRIDRNSYMDNIADIICENYNLIQVNIEGLREKNFKITSHNGTCEIETPVTQNTEKRICRALFNHNDHHLGALGTAIDYEVPFKKDNQSKQGDIDLLSRDSNNIFIIEVKQQDDNISILKAILQAFSYSLLVQQVRSIFFMEYQFKGNELITPTILVFNNSECGKELRELNNHHELRRLLHLINESCIKRDIGRLRFFTIMNDDRVPLVEETHQDCRHPKILFQNGFSPIIKEVLYEC
jgi:hypothetical protein